ncbi:MAG: hypothetical protein JOZ16_02920 [Methylobacteriaceae bacterium]|nr:hypothetical protein [Methylobacteriaceae bacterium]
MGKKLIVAAALSLAFGGLLPIGGAPAQPQAPIGHRQPTASDVPANDSVRGDNNLGGQPAVQTSTKRSRAARTRSDVEMMTKTPNICSNCND